ncbi:MAG: transglutaminase, partial [Rhizobiales bacterium 32-66-8]
MTTRRDILKAGALATAAAFLPLRAFAQTLLTPGIGKWRSFQIVTTVEILKPSGKVQAWLPVASFSNPDWFKPGDNSWTTNASAAKLVRDPNSGADMLHLQWAEGEPAPKVELTSKATT